MFKVRVAICTILLKGKYSENECKYFTQAASGQISQLRGKFTEACKQNTCQGWQETITPMASSECNFLVRPAGILQNFTQYQTCWHLCYSVFETKDWLRGVCKIILQDDKSQTVHQNKRQAISPGYSVPLVFNSVFRSGQCSWGRIHQQVLGILPEVPCLPEATSSLSGIPCSQGLCAQVGPKYPEWFLKFDLELSNHVQNCWSWSRNYDEILFGTLFYWQASLAILTLSIINYHRMQLFQNMVSVLDCRVCSFRQ